jgi:hypothetical protein
LREAIFMENKVLAKYFSKSTKFLAYLLVLISLTTTPVYAELVSDNDKSDRAAARVTRHMDKMKQKCPGMDEKKKQIEEKLRNGTMRPKEACSHCHIKERGSRPTGG